MTTPFDDPQAELAWMFLQNLCADGDLDEAFDLLSDDFVYWSNVTRTESDKTALRRESQRRKDIVDITLDWIGCVNEGETVVVEAQADGVNAAGVRYDSPSVFVVETRDGLITSIREYSDTRLAIEIFGGQSA